MLVFCADVVAVLQIGVQQAFCVGAEKFHGEVHTIQLAAINWQIPWRGCTCGKQHGVVVGYQFLNVDILTHIGVGYEFNTLFAHQLDTTINQCLFQFHIGNAVH